MRRELIPSLPKVLLVGGPDVDARLELMRALKNQFTISALGSLANLKEKFIKEGFEYNFYTLRRGTNPMLDIFTFVQLTLILRRLRPHLVHTFDTKPCIWGRLAARLAGVPVVIGTLPGLGSLYASNSIKNRLLRLIYQPLQFLTGWFSDLTIFQNRDDRNQFINAGIISSAKTDIILGSGVATRRFALERISETQRVALKKELGIPADTVVVTMISRIIRSKGVFEFTAAAQEIGQRYPNTYFLLVGPEDNDNLDRLDAKELAKLKNIVNWPGSRQDIPVILSISDIFVLPSAYREGIPRVLLEAASMGLPIVTTNSPGCNEVVEDEVNGILIPVGDTAAFIKAIARLVEQPQTRKFFGSVSRQRAVNRFDISVIAEETSNLYKKMLIEKGYNLS